MKPSDRLMNAIVRRTHTMSAEEKKVYRRKIIKKFVIIFMILLVISVGTPLIPLILPFIPVINALMLF